MKDGRLESNEKKEREKETRAEAEGFKAISAGSKSDWTELAVI